MQVRRSGHLVVDARFARIGGVCRCDSPCADVHAHVRYLDRISGSTEADIFLQKRKVGGLSEFCICNVFSADAVSR